MEENMSYSAINFEEKLAKFSEQWSPKIIAQLNDYHFKLVKFQGNFVWHSHADTDEAFIVLDGEMSIEFRDAKVVLRAGEMFVVPKGVEHKPFAGHNGVKSFFDIFSRLWYLGKHVSAFAYRISWRLLSCDEPSIDRPKGFCLRV
jgi:mannose-6-phosphate isomerase-like protein (cupin superfamily)